LAAVVEALDIMSIRTDVIVACLRAGSKKETPCAKGTVKIWPDTGNGSMKPLIRGWLHECAKAKGHRLNTR